MRQNDFHKQVRIVYRALRRKYGQDKVDEEALRLFKLAFPIALQLGCPRFVHPRGTETPNGVTEAFADTAEAYFPTDTKKQFVDVIRSWGIGDGAACGLVTGVLFSLENRESWSRGELLRFLSDITPLSIRIRKLCPRETGRLMGISEKDMDIMESCGISKSALYKLHGNSIVTDVLYHIFKNLFITPAPRKKRNVTAVQMDLFS